MRTTQIAKAVGIAPRTKRFRAVDETGYPLYLDGEVDRVTEVLTAIRRARTDRQAVDMRTYIVAVGLAKCLDTGRMNIFLAARVRQYTPYQVCRLVATISERFRGEPSIGELADFWINAHADIL